MRPTTRRAAAGLLALSGLGLGAAARAQSGDPLTGTLKAVAERGTILIGVRDNAVPFAFLNKGGQPVGFAVEICRGIAADVARTLNRDLLQPDDPDWRQGVRIVFVPLKSEERFPKVIAGAVDLECGSTTANAERMKTVAFSPVFFLAGTKILVPKDGGAPATSYRDLAGRPLAVSASTTTDAVVKRLAPTTAPPITVMETPTLDAAYEAVAAGQAAGFASDDVLLYGFIAARPDGRRFRVVGDFLSFEPYAVTLRKDDPAFLDVVRASFGRMARDGVLSRGYDRWFMAPLPSGEVLNLPQSAQLAEIYRALGQPD